MNYWFYEKFRVKAGMSFLLAHDGVNIVYLHYSGVNCTTCEYSSEELTLSSNRGYAYNRVFRQDD